MVLWVFGYGSLVWKAGFEYNERVVGFIKGYKRVFNQGKTSTTTTTTITSVKNLSINMFFWVTVLQFARKLQSSNLRKGVKLLVLLV